MYKLLIFFLLTFSLQAQNFLPLAGWDRNTSHDAFIKAFSKNIKEYPGNTLSEAIKDFLIDHKLVTEEVVVEDITNLTACANRKGAIARRSVFKVLDSNNHPFLVVKVFPHLMSHQGTFFYELLGHHIADAFTSVPLAKVLAFGKAKVEAVPFGIIAMPYAKGENLQRLVEKLTKTSGEKREKQLKKLSSACSLAGETLAKLHSSYHSALPTHTFSNAFLTKKRGEVQQYLERSKATNLKWVNFDALEAHIDRIWQQAAETSFHPVYIHGNAKAENFIYSGHQIAMIDLATASKFFSKAGKPSGCAPFDLMRFEETLDLQKAHGLGHREHKALIHAFRKGYEQIRPLPQKTCFSEMHYILAKTQRLGFLNAIDEIKDPREALFRWEVHLHTLRYFSPFLTKEGKILIQSLRPL